MNPAAERLYARGRAAEFPQIVIGGGACVGAAGWWVRMQGIPPAEIESAHRQLDDHEATTPRRAEAQKDDEGPEVTALDDRLEAIAAETLVETPAQTPADTPARTAGGYAGSEQERLDVEAAEVLLAREDDE